MDEPRNVLKPVPWGHDLFPELAPIADEQTLVAGFRRNPALAANDHADVLVEARNIGAKARQASSIMSAEKIMAVYKLSTMEGRMIMELAEALLRVPDATTRDFLIFDKLAPGHWLMVTARGSCVAWNQRLLLPAVLCAINTTKA